MQTWPCSIGLAFLIASTGIRVVGLQTESKSFHRRVRRVSQSKVKGKKLKSVEILHAVESIGYIDYQSSNLSYCSYSAKLCVLCGKCF